jgi:DNA-binding FrmR family transcriptional regulator
MPYGYSENKEAIQRRLRRIEGQVRGLQRMVEEDRYCINILEQVSAATRALQSVALELLDAHLDHCVAEAVGEAQGSLFRHCPAGAVVTSFILLFARA